MSRAPAARNSPWARRRRAFTRRAGGSFVAPRHHRASRTARRGNVTPARNRVTPMGNIEAIPLRGAWTGNRGILHSGKQIVRFHASDLWITCALEFRGRWRRQWQPHHYTFLFFHDEAVSFAAGHRPCAECRRGADKGVCGPRAGGLWGLGPAAKAVKREIP